VSRPESLFPDPEPNEVGKISPAAERALRGERPGVVHCGPL
jgi:hypothetical protein